MPSINEFVSAAKGLVYTGLLETTAWIKSWPWLHIHRFVKLSEFEFWLKIEINKLENKFLEK